MAVTVLCATPAIAERFVAVHKSQISENVYSVDNDSFGQGSLKNGIYLRYRLRTSMTTLQYSAVAFCEDFSLWTLKTDGVSALGYTFPVEEYYKEPNGWIGRANVSAPLFTEGEGKVLAIACEAIRPEIIDRFLAPPAGDDCIAAKDPFTKAVCGSGGDARGNINLLRMRTDRVAAACGQGEYLKGEFQARMTALAICGGRELCSGFAMGGMMSPINQDFKRLIEWAARGSPQPFPVADVCQAGATLQKLASEQHGKAEAEAGRAQAETDLLRCAKNAAQRLDDRVTDAKVVANASINSCSSENRKLMMLYARAEPSIDSRPVVERIEGQVVPFVLEARARTRKK